MPKATNKRQVQENKSNENDTATPVVVKKKRKLKLDSVRDEGLGQGQISDDVNKVEGDLGNQLHETEEIDQQFDENDEDGNNDDDDDDDLFESGDLLDIEDKSSAVDEDNIYKQRFFRPALNEKEIENITANRPAMRSSSVTHSKNLDCFERFTLPRLRKTWNSHFEPLTDEAAELYKTLMTYKDFSYPKISSENVSCVNNVITLHVLNHVMRARSLVVANNRFLRDLDCEDDEDFDVDLYRDQSITRPSVLILTPFKNTAYNIFKIIEKLFVATEKKHVVVRKNRFKSEFGPQGFKPVSEYRPQDYLDLMTGNVDDNFKVGLSVSANSIRAFSPFHQSDVIIASPLSLFQLVGSSKDRNQHFDFLSGIQILFIDQADVILMQNWANVSAIMESMNKRPKSNHDTNFSRVFSWCLDEQMQYFRQTILTSRFRAAEFNSLFSKFCVNISGRITQDVALKQSELNRVLASMPHVFRRFTASSVAQQDDDRFNFFTKEVLRELKNVVATCKVAIFISDYFDFVRVRNHLRRANLDFLSICEYDSYKKARVRMKKFRKGTMKFLLLTERFYFYHRLHMQGIQRLLFYQLPRYAHFYSELCNMVGVGTSEETEISCSSIFCVYDYLKVLPIVGEDVCTRLLKSENTTNLFVTGKS